MAIVGMLMPPAASNSNKLPHHHHPMADLSRLSPNEHAYVRVPSEPRTDTDWIGVGDRRSDPFLQRPADKDQQPSKSNDGDDGDEDDKARRLAELKTSVFDTYAVCAALLSSFACSTNFISEEELLSEPMWRRVAIGFQQFLVRVCIVGGIHSMLIFMFCALYAKTALARKEFALEIYTKFIAETGQIRMTAFYVMYYTAILYCIQIAVSTFYSLNQILSVIVSTFLLALIARVVWDAQTIIKSAGIIFMPDDKVAAILVAKKESTTERTEATTNRSSVRDVSADK